MWSPPPDDAPRRLADLRVHYDAGTLDWDDLDPDPYRSFQRWFDEAVAVGLPEPNAMIVATADARMGRPASEPIVPVAIVRRRRALKASAAPAPA